MTTVADLKVKIFADGADRARVEALCSEPWETEYTFTVELPDPGVPADPGQICAQNPPSVISNRARASQ